MGAGIGEIGEHVRGRAVVLEFSTRAREILAAAFHGSVGLESLAAKP